MKTCEVCPNEFAPRTTGTPQRFCSAPCRSRVYREANRARRRAYSKRYHVANRAKRLANANAWHAANPEYGKLYHAANRDRLRANAKAWHAANPEYMKLYYAANRDRALATAKAWTAANPDARRANRQRRRAKQAGNGGSFTVAEWRDKCALLGNLCIYCGRADIPMTVDHKTPIARGGRNDIDNVVPACMPCNSRKGTRTAEEFAAA